MPLLDIFWAMLWFFLFVAWISVLFSVITDLFQNRDMGGVAKALWVVFLIFLPVLGVLFYVITQGQGMAERQAERMAASEQAARTYIQEAAGAPSTADELEKLAALRDNGTITADEFAAQKTRLLA